MGKKNHSKKTLGKIDREKRSVRKNFGLRRANENTELVNKTPSNFRKNIAEKKTGKKLEFGECRSLRTLKEESGKEKGKLKVQSGWNENSE